MLVLSTKWTKISLKEEFCLYYVGSSDGIISFCWGTWTFLLSTLVLQYWFKLLYTWMVSELSRTVLGLVKIIFCCFSLTFCLYFSQGGEVFSFVESCLCSTDVVLRCIYWSNFLEARLFWFCFDICVFVSFLICIIFFRLFVSILDLDWRSFDLVLFSCLYLVCG